MKKSFLPAALVGLVAGAIGCSQEAPVVSPDALSAFGVNDVNGQSSSCTDLLAGQTIPAGTVCFTVVGDVLEVTYATTDGWELTEAHLWVGCDPEGYPQTKKGSPIPGHFPYKAEKIDGATSWTFDVDLTQFPCLDEIVCDPGNLLYVMAHAVVRKDDGNGGYQTQTGWADGNQVPGANWATQVVITLKDDSCGGGGEEHCFDGEVAFAFGGTAATCFLTMDEDSDGTVDFDRWGWTNVVAPGSYSWPLFAGAMGCDRTKGHKVGTVTVDYDGSTATVSYDMDPVAGWTIAATHLYVGSEVLPRDVDGDFTVAPRLFPSGEEFSSCSDADGTHPDPFICDSYGATTATYVFTGLSGTIHVVAHASVLHEVECP